MSSLGALCASLIWGEGISLLDVELGEAQGDIEIVAAVLIGDPMDV